MSRPLPDGALAARALTDATNSAGVQASSTVVGYATEAASSIDLFPYSARPESNWASAYSWPSL